MLFGFEWWLLRAHLDLPFSPFSKGSIEASRARGYCRAIKAIREQLLGVPGPLLTQSNFWQLHHMYVQLGWQGTAPASPLQFALDAQSISLQAAKEYSKMMQEVERVNQKKVWEQPYTLKELKQLDEDWGLYYLLTRVCLASNADDKHLDLS